MPFYFGTHYLALHMLEGFLTREEIVVCSVPHGSRFRFDLLMNGEIEATTLTEPYVTLAEKKGCRLVCSAFYHGTQVGTDKIDAETMSAYNRAVGEAVRRINANKRGYLHYFIDYHKARDPEIGTLTRRRSARKPPRRVRAGADPARRDAAHLRLGEELGHAGNDADAARTRQRRRADAGARGGVITSPAAESG